ncbi:MULTISPECIES: type II secretion system secretin GspD [Myxococcus]|uniref:Type II secretion system protein GspD n=1 Tax=Myxococcus xanthus TaxID=34 RepID=A0AAE6FYF9_MYXXA|nr:MULTISPECIES: type II secretion system secretin GspD [Myxococcus]QDE67655.1 type II secretion system protein GspD [Myxococcus xanthus]QDE74932.1 type II secretion system protein GspD [Myxococcus xanthus]QDE96503.1 type II secretion system protein GspD [Myxococcus xanthus]QDF03990.1 type II secretion system protein GspD [Myxococcus xanthus]WAM28953.1 type II secretion system secretin GspD [Myxococcus sp. NMCA1]
MKTLPSWMLCLCLALAIPAQAQRRSPPSGSAGERTISPQGSGATSAGDATAGPRRTPTCEEARRNARYGIYFDKVEIEKLVQTVADATCRTFILPENVRGKISIIGPENGRVEVNADAFYSAFLASLDANGLAVYQYGRFMKIVDKRSAKQNPIPTIVEDGEPYTTNEQMVTKLFRVQNVEVEPLRGVLQQLVSKDGDTIPYPPDTIIINDVGSNIHRLERIIHQLDTRAASDEMRIIQVQYASAQDVANTVQRLFEAKGARPGQPAAAGRTVPPASAQAAPQAGQGQEGSTGGPVTLSQIIPDERTNKLIIVASPAAFERIQDIVGQIDIPTSGGGRINVYYLENANAEELASTLQSLAQGTGNTPRGRTPVQARPPGAPGGPTTTQAAELFSGEVKISADKGSNSLVIVASSADYKNIVQVIQQLDKPRRQVFVEAVIMEVNLDRNARLGMNLHSGFSLSTENGAVPGLIGTNTSGNGLPPSLSLTSLASYGGFLAGIQGPVIPALEKLGIPAFGVVLHAMQQSSDVNVLSTPHILTSDNEEAEITVGQNVPFQSGFNPSSLGSLGGGVGAGGVAGGLGGGLLGGLGGLGSLYAPITRQNVELKLTVKPQINESDYIRLVINQQTEEIASTDPVLGPTTSRRSAKTTVIARDQETLVIGGIMQDRTLESVSKVPLLGDIPLLGHLFRDTTRRKTKTNLLLFLTPYIIRGPEDFRVIFERKMKERQQFVEQFYGQVPGYDVAVDFTRKPGPLSRMGQKVTQEEQRAENGGPGVAGERVITPAPPPASGPGAVPSTQRQAPVAPAEEGGPAVREGMPPPDGSEEPVPAPAPQNFEQPPSEAIPVPEAGDAERLRIQPEAGEQTP